MDEFARLMLHEGVRPLGSSQAIGRSPVRGSEPAPIPTQHSAAQAGPAWVTGAEARRALEAAVSLADEDRRGGRDSWVTGVRQDGTCLNMGRRTGVAEMLAEADRLDLRLVIVAGKGWTCMMHPAMGIATIEGDVADHG